MPSLNALAQKSFDDTHSFAEVVLFVHVLVIEPHPMAPDLSPYNGQVWEGRYSTVNQPMSYDERLAVAHQLAELIEGEQLLLIDELAPNGLNNPVWCTFGPSPNSAFLIRQDGIVEVAQLWLDTDEMEQAMRALLSQQ